MPYRTRAALWTSWVVLGLLLLPFASGVWYLGAVAATGLALCLVPGAVPQESRLRDPLDLFVIAGLFTTVVALNRAAFVGFTQDNVVGLFLCFAAALLIGVAGPVHYSVWVRRRTLGDLGLRRDNLGTAALLALGLGSVQFALTLWHYDLPAPEDWVPLLVMSLVVGVFEAVFFRGFIQTSLERQFGPVVGVAGAAVLYGVYHVGYGMGPDEVLFLTGLGAVYAVAFALAHNLFVLWPLLTPLGSFYANVDAGDIELPWASIAGFADVLGLMVLVGWLATRRQHKTAATVEREKDVPADIPGRAPGRW